MWRFQWRAAVVVVTCGILAAVPCFAQDPAGNATADSHLLVVDPTNVMESGAQTSVVRPVYDVSGTAIDLNLDGKPERVTLYFDDGTFVANQAGSDWEVQMQLSAGLTIGRLTDHTGGANHVAAHLFNRACQPAPGSVFTIEALQFSKVPVDVFFDPFLFTLERLKGTFTLNCNTNVNTQGPISGEFDFTKIGTTTGGGGTPDDPTAPEPEPPPPFQIALPAELSLAPVVIANSGSQTVKFNTLIDSTFNSDLHLSVFSNALDTEDFRVELTPTFIAAPGAGEAELAIHTGPLTFPRRYTVTVFAMAGDVSSGISFIVDVQCTPPFILGVDQQQSITAAPGSQVEVKVIPSGSGPFFYEWYRGWTGMTRSPVASTGASLLVNANGTETYWARVRNACGSVDSVPVTVTGQ